MINWAMLELPEYPEPGVWVGANFDAILLAKFDEGGEWVRVGVLTQPATMLEVVKWPVVECPELRSSPTGTLAYVYGEVIRFKSAELVGRDRYMLGDVERGLRGTKQQTTFRPGASGVLLETGLTFFPVHPRMCYRDSYWKCVPDGGSPSECSLMPARLTGVTRPSLVGPSASLQIPTKVWGARYIVDVRAPRISTWLDEWVYADAEIGHTVWVPEESRLYVWDGREWLPLYRA